MCYAYANQLEVAILLLLPSYSNSQSTTDVIAKVYLFFSLFLHCPPRYLSIFFFVCGASQEILLYSVKTFKIYNKTANYNIYLVSSLDRPKFSTARYLKNAPVPVKIKLVLSHSKQQNIS